jgi:hypothetical protein
MSRRLGPKPLPTVGLRFGKLVALEVAGRNARGNLTYRCRCDCGNEKVIVHRELHRGHTTSCGCVRFSRLRAGLNKLPHGQAAFNLVLGSYKRQAKARDLVFELDIETFRALTSSDCYYCGTPPSQVWCGSTSARINGNYTYNGIDRVDNDRGYVDGNVRPCCGQCNRSKRDLTEAAFLAWLARAYRRLHAQEA